MEGIMEMLIIKKLQCSTLDNSEMQEMSSALVQTIVRSKLSLNQQLTESSKDASSGPENQKIFLFYEIVSYEVKGDYKLQNRHRSGNITF